MIQYPSHSGMTPYFSTKQYEILSYEDIHTHTHQPVPSGNNTSTHMDDHTWDFDLIVLTWLLAYILTPHTCHNLPFPDKSFLFSPLLHFWTTLEVCQFHYCYCKCFMTIFCVFASKLFWKLLRTLQRKIVVTWLCSCSSFSILSVLFVTLNAITD